MPTQIQEDSNQKSSSDVDLSQRGKSAGGDGNEKKNQPDEDNGNQKRSSQTKDDQGNKENKEEEKPMDPATKRRRIILTSVVVCVLLIGGVLWYLHSLTYEDTDDAQIDGHLNAIAARVSGTITKVYAENEQPVQAGQPLIDLDPKDYEVQVEQARASYEQALAQTQAQNPNVPITQTTNESTINQDQQANADNEAALASAERDYKSNLAKLRQAIVNNQKSQADLVRYKELVAKEEISKSDYDQYVANAGSGDANVEASQFTADSSAKIVEERRAQLRQQYVKSAQDKANAPRQIAIQHATLSERKATADSYKAQLDTALLNLSYCRIVSPVNGIASERSAEVGGRINSGQQLIVIVQTDTVFVTANFKETQLRKMRVGQPVAIKVDSLRESFDGKVEYMPAATGDKASLFPAENATGNYVKIVQRLPVRISINPNQRDFDKLRPGMSVEPKVYLDR